jgi:hypothetical protein
LSATLISNVPLYCKQLLSPWGTQDTFLTSSIPLYCKQLFSPWGTQDNFWIANFNSAFKYSVYEIHATAS